MKTGADGTLSEKSTALASTESKLTFGIGGCNNSNLEEMSAQTLEQEERRRERALPALQGFVALSILFFLGRLIALPEGSNALFDLWLYQRIQDGLTASSILAVFIVLRQSSSAWRGQRYDLIVFLWGSYFLAHIACTRQQKYGLLQLSFEGDEYDDQPLQLLLGTIFVALFIGYLEVGVVWAAALVHVHIGACLAWDVVLGDGADRRQLWGCLGADYVLCCLLLVCGWRERRIRRKLWRQEEEQVATMAVLEQWAKSFGRCEADEEPEVSIYECTQALVVEHRAWQPFVAAVFDVFGRLEWRIAQGLDKPELCFGQETNSTLDELFGQSLAGQPLDFLLGPEPETLTAKADWWREQERLHTFVALEVGSGPSGADQSLNSDPTQVARKITLSCKDVAGKVLDIDLLLRRGHGKTALFGILRSNNAAVGGSDKPSNCNSVRLHVLEALSVESSCEWAGGSSAASALPLPLKDQTGFGTDVLAWVDAAAPCLPVLKCTQEFEDLMGCSLGSSLKERMFEGDRFETWLREGLHAPVAQSTADDARDAPKVTRVRMRSAWSHGEEIRAECLSNFSVDGQGEDLVDCDVRPVLLAFMNISQGFFHGTDPSKAGAASGCFSGRTLGTMAQACFAPSLADAGKRNLVWQE